MSHHIQFSFKTFNYIKTGQLESVNYLLLLSKLFPKIFSIHFRLSALGSPVSAFLPSFFTNFQMENHLIFASDFYFCTDFFNRHSMDSKFIILFAFKVAIDLNEWPKNWMFFICCIRYLICWKRADRKPIFHAVVIIFLCVYFAPQPIADWARNQKFRNGFC